MTHHTAHRPVPPSAPTTGRNAERSTWAAPGRGRPPSVRPHAQRQHNQMPGPHQGGQKQP